MRQGDAIDPFHLANGFEAVIGYEYQERGEGGADAPAACARPSEHAAAPTRPASADAIKVMMLALDRGHQSRSGVPGGGSTDDAAGSDSEGQQGSGTHLAGQVAVAGDGALVNIGKTRDRAKKGTGSSASVQDIARRVREWGIQKPPRAKHSAWRWAFKYKTPPRHNPAGYEHQALCSLCLQAKDLERATIKLGKSDSPTALMQHLQTRERPMRSLTPRSRLKMTKYLDAGDQ